MNSNLRGPEGPFGPGSLLPIFAGPDQFLAPPAPLARGGEYSGGGPALSSDFVHFVRQPDADPPALVTQPLPSSAHEKPADALAGVVRASSEPSERDADEALWGPIADIFGIRYPATVSPDSQPPATDPAPAVIYEELAAKGSQPPAITEPKADSPEGGEKDADSDEPEFSWLPLVEEPPDISEVPADSPQGDGGDTSPPKELSDSARAPEVGGVIVDVDITDNPPAIGQVLIREVYGIPVLGDPDPSFPEHLPKGDERRDMQPGIDFSEVPEAAVTAALEDILDRLKRHVWPDEKGFEEGAPRGTRKIQVTEEEVVSGGIWELVKRALSSEGQRDEG